MIIIGAGLAGLLAGNMLRRHKPIIYEAQASLPNNHAALLRFRTSKVGDACGITFKKVKVSKAINYDGNLTNYNSIALQNMYSHKVTGEYHPRSIGSLEDCERYIAPENFIEQAAANLNIVYDKECALPNELGMAKRNFPIISTIPMNLIMNIIGWKEKPEFKYLPIWSITAEVPGICNLHQTIYYPGKDIWYRASITGNKLIVECIKDPVDESELTAEQIANMILFDFGIDEVITETKIKYQKYGKLLPIDDNLRKRFMLHLTQNYGIYSLGRFATWRQILMDDCVNDVNVIENMITKQDAYSNNKHWSSK